MVLKLPILILTSFIVYGSNGANFSIDHDYYKLTIYEPDKTNLDYNQYLTDMSDSTVHQRLSNQSVGAANLDLKVNIEIEFWGMINCQVWVVDNMDERHVWNWI